MAYVCEKAFLNDELKEHVYMTQPEGFIPLSNHNKVYKLQRFIYGLKQVCRSWSIHFNKIIEWFNLVGYEEGLCEYKKVTGSITFICR